MEVLGLGAKGKIHIHGGHAIPGPHFLRKSVWELFEGENTRDAVRAAYSECFANGTPQDVMVDGTVLRFLKPDIPPQVIAWSETLPEPHPLDENELELLRLYADGLSTPQVIEKLGTSETSVRRLRQSIGVKLQLDSIIQACVWAAKRGLL